MNQWIEGDVVVSGLPLHFYRTGGTDKPTLLLAHGFSDNGLCWSRVAREMEVEFDLIMVDARNHGQSGRGICSSDDLADDLAAVIAGLSVGPTFALGHSMGAGVILAAEAQSPIGTDGLILAAPGVWGGRALPIHYRLSATLAAVFAPGKALTGERVQRRATDNIEILREMYADPLVIKDTRIDAILGVTRVMGSAYNNADDVNGAVLFLMGEKDEIIPLKAMEKTAMRLSGDITFRRYPDGWHMLLRDLQAAAVWRDVADWISKRSAASTG